MKFSITFLILIIPLFLFVQIPRSSTIMLQSYVPRKMDFAQSSENKFYNLNFSIMDSSRMDTAYEYKAFISFDFSFTNNHTEIMFNLTFFELGRTESHMEIYAYFSGIYIYKNYVAGVSGYTGKVHDIEITSWLAEYKFPHTSRGEPILWRLTAYSNDLEIILSTVHINTTTIIPTIGTLYNTFIPNSSIADEIFPPQLVFLPVSTTTETTIVNITAKPETNYSSSIRDSKTSLETTSSIGSFFAGIALITLIIRRKHKQ